MEESRDQGSSITLTKLSLTDIASPGFKSTPLSVSSLETAPTTTTTPTPTPTPPPTPTPWKTNGHTPTHSTASNNKVTQIHTTSIADRNGQDMPT